MGNRKDNSGNACLNL